MSGYLEQRPSIASLYTKLKKLPALKRAEGQVSTRMNDIWHQSLALPKLLLYDMFTSQRLPATPAMASDPGRPSTATRSRQAATWLAMVWASACCSDETRA